MNKDKDTLALAPPVKPESNSAREMRLRHERFLVRQAEKEKKAAKAEAIREQLHARAARVDPDLPRVELTSDPDSIRVLTETIDSNTIPDTYVRSGVVVSVEKPSGAVAGPDAPPVVIVPVDARRLSRLLAQHTYTYEIRSKNLPGGESETFEYEVMPKDTVSGAVLAAQNWPKLRPLIGVVTSPIFRPDGTLLQEPGYDPATSVIYAPKLSLKPVPDSPTVEELRLARRFVLDELLHDFPWVGPSRTNYIGLLVAPLIRSYLGGALVPMGAIDAASPSSGKTLLTQIAISVYSGYTRAWVSDDVELRKAITSILLDQGGAIVVLDNVPKNEVVDQATLSMLLTKSVWSDRILGLSESHRLPNDRVWFVTGNALSIGGDNTSRTVPMRLDAEMPDPDQRPPSKFALGDLEEWLTKPGNCATVLHHLLVLVRGWIVAGAKTIETPMRTFTPWASATAGFLDWLGTPGFMTNRYWLNEGNEEETTYGAFYARWYEILGDRQVKAAELHASALPDGTGTTQYDWKDTFLVRKRDGQIPSVHGLGKMLSAERGNYRGGFRLNAEYDNHGKFWAYSVQPAAVPAVPEVSA